MKALSKEMQGPWDQLQNPETVSGQGREPSSTQPFHQRTGKPQGGCLQFKRETFLQVERSQSEGQAEGNPEHNP